MMRRRALSVLPIIGSLLITSASCGASGFHPYAVSCVSNSFARSGIPLLEPYGAAKDQQNGFALLVPAHGDVAITVAVAATKARTVPYLAELKVAGASSGKTHLFQAGNVVINTESASLPASLAKRITSALDDVKSRC
jgi:hypothetical protein